MINKKIIKLVFAVFIAVSYIDNIYAASNNYVPMDFSMPTEETGDTVVLPDEPPKKKTAALKREEGSKVYECYSEISASGGMYMMLKFTNHKKQQILNKDLSFKGVAFKAGTWIGISTEEYRSGSWSVEVEIEERRKVWTCNWERDKYVTVDVCYNNEDSTDYYYLGRRQCIEGYSQGTVTEHITETYTTSADTDGGITNDAEACGGKNSSTFVGGRVAEEYTVGASNPQLEEDCYNQEESKAIAKVEAEMGKDPNNIWYITNNVYPKNAASITMQKLEGVETLAEKPCEKDPEGKVHSGECYYITAKKPTNVCLNRKTAAVKYNTGVPGCEKDELDVTGWTETFEDEEPQLNHFIWRYFIPLNTKSGNDNWYIRIQSGNNNLPSKQCKAIIRNYPSNYVDYIVPILGGEFSGESSRDNETIEVDKGCKLMIKFSFNIKQEFYHETKNNEIQGYEFYYRPIDIDNPFPNGIDRYSYWYEWSITPKMDRINLADSYSKIYYSTRNNISAIREYNSNEENPYTSWAKIDLKGTSEFVQKYLDITDDSKKHYELGCGPGTEDLEECNK